MKEQKERYFYKKFANIEDFLRFVDKNKDQIAKESDKQTIYQLRWILENIENLIKVYSIYNTKSSKEYFLDLYDSVKINVANSRYITKKHYKQKHSDFSKLFKNKANQISIEIQKLLQFEYELNNMIVTAGQYFEANKERILSQLGEFRAGADSDKKLLEDLRETLVIIDNDANEYLHPSAIDKLNNIITLLHNSSKHPNTMDQNKDKKEVDQLYKLLIPIYNIICEDKHYLKQKKSFDKSFNKSKQDFFDKISPYAHFINCGSNNQEEIEAICILGFDHNEEATYLKTNKDFNRVPTLVVELDKFINELSKNNNKSNNSDNTTDKINIFFKSLQNYGIQFSSNKIITLTFHGINNFKKHYIFAKDNFMINTKDFIEKTLLNEQLKNIFTKNDIIQVNSCYSGMLSRDFNNNQNQDSSKKAIIINSDFNKKNFKEHVYNFHNYRIIFDQNIKDEFIKKFGQENLALFYFVALTINQVGQESKMINENILYEINTKNSELTTNVIKLQDNISGEICQTLANKYPQIKEICDFVFLKIKEKSRNNSNRDLVGNLLEKVKLKIHHDEVYDLINIISVDDKKMLEKIGDNYQNNMLHMAAFENKNRIFKIILDKYPALLNWKNNGQHSAISVATHNNNIELVKLCIDKGAFIDNNLVTYADPLKPNHSEVTKLIKDAILERKDFLTSLEKGNAHTINVMLQKNPELINLRDENNNTLLHQVIQNPSLNNKLGIIVLLNKLSPEMINQKNNANISPLELIQNDKFLYQELSNITFTLLKKVKTKSNTISSTKNFI